MHVSGFDEPCNAPPDWHCSFHTINQPQLSLRLKYFIRLVGIGIAYCGEAGDHRAELGENAEYGETKVQQDTKFEKLEKLFIA